MDTEVDRLNHKVGKLVINSEEPSPPANWPASLVYTTSLIWEGIDGDFRKNFEDSTEVTPLVQELQDPKSNQHGLLANANGPLSEGVWLGEYTGAVKRLDQLKDDRFAVLLYSHNASGITYVIDAREVGNELRYIRQSKGKDVNCKLYRIWVDGIVRVFLQITKDVDSSMELVRDYEEPLLTDGQRKLIEGDTTDYAYSHVLNFDALTPEQKTFLTTKRTLEDIGYLQTIDNKNHPCHGQVGIFSKNHIKNGDYLGEYTGRVLTRVEEPFSKYLVDFSNPHSEGCDKVWADALVEGNEMRFINDYKNTGSECNVNFRKMFLDGIMRVYVQAIADLNPGDEILVDYGSGYWDNIPAEEESPTIEEEEVEILPETD